MQRYELFTDRDIRNEPYVAVAMLITPRITSSGSSYSQQLSVDVGQDETRRATPRVQVIMPQCVAFSEWSVAFRVENQLLQEDFLTCAAFVNEAPEDTFVEGL